MESADGVGNSLRRKVREGLGSTKAVIETPVSVLVYQTRDAIPASAAIFIQANRRVGSIQ